MDRLGGEGGLELTGESWSEGEGSDSGDGQWDGSDVCMDGKAGRCGEGRGVGLCGCEVV